MTAHSSIMLLFLRIFCITFSFLRILASAQAGASHLVSPNRSTAPTGQVLCGVSWIYYMKNYFSLSFPPLRSSLVLLWKNNYFILPSQRMSENPSIGKQFSYTLQSDISHLWLMFIVSLSLYHSKWKILYLTVFGNICKIRRYTDWFLMKSYGLPWSSAAFPNIL